MAKPTARHSTPRGAAARVIELKWEDPPPEVPTYVEPYLGVLEELHAKPGHWAQLATFENLSGGSTAEKKLGKGVLGLGLGTFEFTSRRRATDNTSAVWGCCTATE